jgi:hypothetical protein
MVKRNSLDDWLDRQEESRQRDQLNAAIEEAQAAGVDVPSVMDGARKDYEERKTDQDWPVLIACGIRNENDFAILALNVAMKRARGQL